MLSSVLYTCSVLFVDPDKLAYFVACPHALKHSSARALLYSVTLSRQAYIGGPYNSCSGDDGDTKN